MSARRTVAVVTLERVVTAIAPNFAVLMASWVDDGRAGQYEVAHLALLLFVTGRAPGSGDGADAVHGFGEFGP